MSEIVPIHDVLCACRYCHAQGRSATDALQEVIDRVNAMGSSNG